MTVHRTRSDDAILHPSGWARLPSGAEVTRLPLMDRATKFAPFPGQASQLFARLTYADALEVAGRSGARIISPEALTELGNVGLQLTPYLGTPTAETALVHSERHDADVWRQLAAQHWDGKQPVSGAGKHWVSGAPPGRSRLMGWDKDGAGPGKALWQPLMVAHNRQHHDDGTTTMLERDGDATPDTQPGGPVVPPISKAGDDPARVQAWQVWLTAHGYALKVDGDHGPKTAAATARALAEHPEWMFAKEPAVAVPKPAPVYRLIRAKNFTYADRKIGDVYFVTGHSIQCPPTAGRAIANAEWFAGPKAKNASIHWWVDPAEVIQGLEEKHLAWGARSGPERHAQHHAIHVEHAGYTREPAYRSSATGKLIPEKPQTNWLGDGLPIVERSAKLVAEIINRWDLLPEQVTTARMVAWRDAIRRGDKAAAWKLRGINLHINWAEAYDLKGDHTDIGGWPWPEYLEMVKAAL